MKKLFKAELLEKIYVVLSLLYFSGGPLALILSGGASQGDGKEVITSHLLLRIISLSVYIINIFLLTKLKLWKSVVNLLIKEKFILLLVVVAGVSVFWSYAPQITVRRSVALAGTTVFGIYFATRYSLKQQLQLLCYTFCIVVVLSFLFALISPNYGIMGGPNHEGLWRGIYTHKNYLGKAMVVSLAAFLIVANSNKNRLFLWCGFGLSVILLLLSTSKTALSSALIILATVGIYWTLQKYYSRVFPVVVAIVVIGGSLFLQVTIDFYPPLVLSEASSAILQFPSSSQANSATKAPPEKPAQANSATKAPSVKSKVPSTSSKDLRTLTGRTELWPNVLNMIEKRFWLGYGYEAFWLGWNGPSAQVWRAMVSWKQPPHAHNGLLDLWLDLGTLGVSIFLGGFLVTLLRMLTWVGLQKESENFWSLIYIMFILLFNLTTSTLVKSNDLYWVLYVAVVFSMLIAHDLQTKQREDA